MVDSLIIFSVILLFILIHYWSLREQLREHQRHQIRIHNVHQGELTKLQVKHVEQISEEREKALRTTREITKKYAQWMPTKEHLRRIKNELERVLGYNLLSPITIHVTDSLVLDLINSPTESVHINTIDLTLQKFGLGVPTRRGPSVPRVPSVPYNSITGIIAIHPYNNFVVGCISDDPLINRAIDYIFDTSYSFYQQQDFLERLKLEAVRSL